MLSERNALSRSKRRPNGDRPSGVRSAECGVRSDLGWAGDLAESAPAETQAEQAANEVLEAHLFVGVVADGELLAGGIDRARRIEAGGVDAQVDVGHERPQQDHAITALDVLPDVVAAHRAFIDAEVERMVLANDGLAEHGRRHGDIGLARELEELVLQAEPVHLHVRQDDRLARGVDHLLGFGQGLAQALEVAPLVQLRRLVVGNAGHGDEVAGQLDIDRPLEPQRGVQHAIDFLEGRLRVAQDRRGDGKLLEHLLLGVKLADLVMQQGVLLALLHPRRAADDDHGRLLGKGFGGGIGELQSAHAVGDADRAQAAHAGVGIGGEAGALLVAGVDEAQLAAGRAGRKTPAHNRPGCRTRGARHGRKAAG